MKLNNCKNIIKITSAPVTPATLSGPTTLCPLASGNYTSSSVVNATSYIWSTTGGLIIVSGQGTTSAVIKAPAGFSSGNRQGTAKAGSDNGARFPAPGDEEHWLSGSDYPRRRSLY